MRRTSSLPRLSLVALLVSQTFVTLPAFAAGFQINEISPGLQGDATAGAAAADNDVSSIFINPATLASLKENQFYIGGSEIMPHVSMSGASAIHTVNIPGIPPSNISATVLGSTSQSSIAKSAFAPNAYFGIRINKKFVAGISITAPYGLTTSYDNGSVLRFAADNSMVETINITPAISYEITDKIAVGVGLQVQYLQAEFSNYNGPYTSVAPIDALVASNYPTYLNGSGWGYGYTLGLLFKPDQLTRIGAGFRSQVSEPLRGSGRQFTSPGGLSPAPSAAFLFNADSPVSTNIKTPGVFTLSAARDIGDWTVKASAQLNLWYTFNQLSIDMPNAFATNSTLQTRWSNSWLGAVGADWRITPDWTARTGVAYDQSPTSDRYRDPRIPDSDRVWLAFGASYKINKSFALDGTYTHIFILNQSVNVTQASGISSNSTVPLEVNQVQANYKASVDIVGVALRYSF